METREITIRVDAEAARAYAASSPEEGRKLDLLLGLRLGEVTGPSAPLEKAMKEIGEKSRQTSPSITRRMRAIELAVKTDTFV